MRLNKSMRLFDCSIHGYEEGEGVNTVKILEKAEAGTEPTCRDSKWAANTPLHSSEVPMLRDSPT